MRHVFVETTWVVSYAAPAHLGMPAARDLLAQAGDKLRLYVPSVCISEALHAIRRKHQARPEADRVRQYLRWAKGRNTVTAGEDEIVRRVLDQMEEAVRNELNSLDATLGTLREQQGVEVFGLTDSMIERAMTLSTANLDLKPFDLAILAAVLARAETIPREHDDEVDFCCLDSDLQPWDKEGRSRKPLNDLYEAARIKVFGDFALETPPGFET